MRNRLAVLPMVLALAALSGCGDETSGGSSGSDSSDKKSETSSKTESSKKDAGCGTKATDDCTPHVGPNGKVRVDALIYRVLSVNTAKTVGNQYTQEKADGTFVIINLRVRSDKDESCDAYRQHDQAVGSRRSGILCGQRGIHCGPPIGRWSGGGAVLSSGHSTRHEHDRKNRL